MKELKLSTKLLGTESRGQRATPCEHWWNRNAEGKKFRQVSSVTSTGMGYWGTCPLEFTNARKFCRPNVRWLSLLDDFVTKNFGTRAPRARAPPPGAKFWRRHLVILYTTLTVTREALVRACGSALELWIPCLRCSCGNSDGRSRRNSSRGLPATRRTSRRRTRPSVSCRRRPAHPVVRGGDVRRRRSGGCRRIERPRCRHPRPRLCGRREIRSTRRRRTWPGARHSATPSYYSAAPRRRASSAADAAAAAAADDSQSNTETLIACLLR